MMFRLGRRGTLFALLCAIILTITIIPGGPTVTHLPSSGLFSSTRSSTLNPLKFGTTPNSHGLYVVPKSTIPTLKEHPITILLREAELKAASMDRKIESIQTLSDAVEDYRSAYNTDPPIGFDLWYAFCLSAQSVPVPSLLPQAHRSILPFLAYPAELLRERIKGLEEKQATWWFEIVYGEEAEALGEHGNRIKGEDGIWRGVRRGGDANEQGPRARDMASLYEGILPYIPPPPSPLAPPLRLAFGMHDGPAYVTTSSIYTQSLSLARSGLLWDLEELEKEEKQAMSREMDRKGWKWTCGRTTPIWRENGGMGVGGGGKVETMLEEQGEEDGQEVAVDVVEVGARTYIGDIEKSMDFCQNPKLMDLHGTLLNDVSRRTAPMVPQIATSKTLFNVDVLSTPLEATGQTQDYVAWSSKTENRLFWRGKLTGAFHNSWTKWRQSQRERASFLVNRREGEIDVLVDEGNGGGPVLRTFGAAELNMGYMDIAPVDGPVQCDPGECEKVAEDVTFGSRVPKEAQVKYKYILDVDGNAWSSRFRRLLTGMSVTLKSTIFPEWNSNLLIPWYHYIPVQVDYTDIYDIMLYFAGQPDRPETGHDAEAEKIATNARKFAEERWAYEDMQSYMLLMTLEYQRAVSDDRELASYKG